MNVAAIELENRPAKEWPPVVGGPPLVLGESVRRTVVVIHAAPKVLEKPPRPPLDRVFGTPRSAELLDHHIHRVAHRARSDGVQHGLGIAPVGERDAPM